LAHAERVGHVGTIGEASLSGLAAFCVASIAAALESSTRTAVERGHSTLKSATEHPGGIAIEVASASSNVAGVGAHPTTAHIAAVCVQLAATVETATTLKTPATAEASATEVAAAEAGGPPPAEISASEVPPAEATSAVATAEPAAIRGGRHPGDRGRNNTGDQ
jgi:hypothetical protein